MRIACISDRGGKSPLSEDLWRRMRGLAETRGHTLQRVELDHGETSSCTGCLKCWEAPRRECVSQDQIGGLTRNKLVAELAIYLAPVVFGTSNSTVKNAIDRGGLLFAGRTTAQVVIGYAEDMDAEERSTFLDIVAKHRGDNNVVHPESRETVWVFATRSSRDNEYICRRLGDIL